MSEPMSDADLASRRIPPAESTEFPWWIILDPQRITGPLSSSSALHQIAGMVTGPFFSRKEAEDTLKASRYNYGKHARVYCMSGHESDDWRGFCLEKRPQPGDFTLALDRKLPVPHFAANPEGPVELQEWANAGCPGLPFGTLHFPDGRKAEIDRISVRVEASEARPEEPIQFTIGASEGAGHEIPDLGFITHRVGIRCNHVHGISGPRCALISGHEGQHLYRCASPDCPGLTWAASSTAHPFPCTGRCDATRGDDRCTLEIGHDGDHELEPR